MPGLIAGFAKHQGLDLILPSSPDAPTRLSDPATDKVLAEFSFEPLDPAAAHAALAAGRAELVIASASDPAFGIRTIGLDPIEVLVIPRVIACSLLMVGLSFYGGLWALIAGGIAYSLWKTGGEEEPDWPAGSVH